MKIQKVIPSRRWRNSRTGKEVSVYGAFPGSGRDDDEWELVTVGWTWLRDDGCVGLCRKPAETREAAEQVMREFNAR